MGLVAVDVMRAERAEAAYWATYARNIPTTDDTRDTGAIPVAGGYAICLQGSSIEYGLGVGSSRPLREDDLRIVDEFYGSRELPSQLELHPLVAERDARLLARWDYRAGQSTVMLERDIRSDGEIPERFSIETLTSRRAEWTDLVVAGQSDSAEPALARRTRRTTYLCATAADSLVAVRVDGKLAGGGALGVTGDVAFLFCSSTLPGFRGQGVEAALTTARLALGRSRGATFACMAATPGSEAVAGADATGWRAAYVRQRFTRR